MGILIRRQVFEFIVILYGGMCITFLYDLLKIYKKLRKPSRLISSFQDILYWLVSASSLIYMLYYSSYGSVKGYTILSLLMGVVLYKIFISKGIVTAIEGFISLIKKVFGSFYKKVYVKIKRIYKIRQ